MGTSVSPCLEGPPGAAGGQSRTVEFPLTRSIGAAAGMSLLVVPLPHRADTARHVINTQSRHPTHLELWSWHRATWHPKP